MLDVQQQVDDGLLNDQYRAVCGQRKQDDARRDTDRYFLLLQIMGGAEQTLDLGFLSSDEGIGDLGCHPLVGTDVVAKDGPRPIPAMLRGVVGHDGQLP